MKAKIAKLKHKIYILLPKNLQKKAKSFYYDSLIRTFYKLKYKSHYGTTDFFNRILLETTTYCNLRCKFCPNSKYPRGLLKNKKLMPLKLFKKIVNELAEIDYNGVICLHFYGEPLTDKRLPNLVKYIREKLPKANIQLNSNGTLLTIPIYKKLFNAGINSMEISQYGDSMPENLKKIFAYLKTKPKKYNKINYRVFNDKLGLSNRGGEIKLKRLPDRPMCIYPEKEGMIIDYAGNAILCCQDYHSSIKFGNLKNEKLIDIWNKPVYKKLRKELKKQIFKLPICKRCVGLEK